MSGNEELQLQATLLRLVHHHPGRLRVRADVLRDAPGIERAARVGHALAAIPAIQSWSHNPFTGSLLIDYQPAAIEPDEILTRVALAAGLDGFVDEATLRAQGPDPAVAVIHAAGRLNALARELTHGRTDLRVLVPAALLSAAGLSFLRAPILPRWENLAYWAYAVFADLNRKKIADEEARADDDDDDTPNGTAPDRARS